MSQPYEFLKMSLQIKPVLVGPIVEGYLTWYLGSHMGGHVGVNNDAVMVTNASVRTSVLFIPATSSAFRRRADLRDRRPDVIISQNVFRRLNK